MTIFVSTFRHKQTSLSSLSSVCGFCHLSSTRYLFEKFGCFFCIVFALWFGLISPWGLNNCSLLHKAGLDHTFPNLLQHTAMNLGKHSTKIEAIQSKSSLSDCLPMTDIHASSKQSLSVIELINYYITKL